MYLPRQIELYNKEKEPFKIVLREYRPKDVQGIQECIIDEYGDSYFKQAFYNKKYIEEEARTHIIFMVAETEDKKIAGFMILKDFQPEETMCEIASQIFKKKYRHCRLSMPFFQYAIEILKKHSYSAAYCLPVLFHNITQKQMSRLGFYATGVILNVFDLQATHHSYENGKNTKHSQGIQVMPLSKKDVGTLYLPQEQQEFCAKTYQKLGVTFKIQTDQNNSMDQNGVVETSVISYIQDKKQNSLEIRIIRICTDWEQKVENLEKEFGKSERETINIFLNCKDPKAVVAYEKLKQKGYFFTGIRPLCSDKEYMILHYAGGITIHFEDYNVTEEFGELIRYIQKNRVK